MGVDSHTAPISTGVRLALASKALLLCLLGAAIGALTWASLREGGGALLFAPIGAISAAFVLWAARLGLADAIFGEALIERGPIRRLSRISGLTARLPSGRTAEYLLFRVGPPLVDGARYELVIGRRSGVLVRPPRPLQDEEASDARTGASP